MATDIKAKRTGEVAASADELFRFINKVRGGGRRHPFARHRGRPLFHAVLHAFSAAKRAPSTGTRTRAHTRTRARIQTRVRTAQVRAGSSVDANELVKFARLFNDELTLDRLDR